MIDRTAVKRLTLVSAVLFVLASAVAFAVWRSPAVLGGLALGFALGLVPFLSWSWMAHGGFSTARRRAGSIALLVAKLAVYAAALYVLVMRPVVDPAGAFAGITIVVFTFAGGALLLPPARPDGVRP